MKRTNYKRIAVFVIASTIISTSCLAAGPGIPQHKVLRIEKTIPPTEQLHFIDRDQLSPAKGDFKILSIIPMSSDFGERWATITIKNTSPNQRIFDQSYIVATLADGRTINPIHIEQIFKGHQTITLLLNFKIQKFPILRINTSRSEP